MKQTTLKFMLKELGIEIRNRRKQLGFSQEEFAVKSGVHWTYIGGLERGERNPTLKTMIFISDALETSLFDLFRFHVFKTVVKKQNKWSDKIIRRVRRVSDEDRLYKVYKVMNYIK